MSSFIFVCLLIAGYFGLRTLRQILLPLPLDRCESKRFESADWQERSQSHSPAAVRGCMVDDLLKRHTLVGKSRSEVIALLGQPDTTDYFQDCDLVYWLGPEQGLMSIDSEWLIIRLDAQGRVSNHQLVTD
ncbi:hypothetical protein H6F90_13445 [Trichocoleus sp. FACHB-591]|nr:hypothetical protein [Trichocoleus sp. FACHB-591]